MIQDEIARLRQEVKDELTAALPYMAMRCGVYQQLLQCYEKLPDAKLVPILQLSREEMALLEKIDTLIEAVQSCQPTTTS